MDGTNNEVLEDIREIKGATDPVLLFGTNAKRAKLRYRRLMRSVHPDMSHGIDGADEAAQRLNALWESYQRMTDTGRDGTAGRGKGKDAPRDNSHFVHELARTGRFVLFSEGDGWMAVDRQASNRPRPTDIPDLSPLFDILDGTPVRMLKATDEKEIRQADGNHHAVTFEVPKFHEAQDHVMSLIDLKGHVPNGTTEPEDVAWVLKRFLFLVAGLAKAGLALPVSLSLSDAVVLDVEKHVLMLVAPHELVRGTGSIDEQRRHLQTLLDALMAITDMTDRDGASRRLMAFMRGVKVDHVTETADLMAELGELLTEVFGGARFHEMRLV